MLAKRKIIRTTYTDDIVLTTLGIKDDVDYMIDRVGWTVFMSMRNPIYIRVTLEFFEFLESPNFVGGRL